MLAPVIEELAGEYAGRIKFVKLNTDENPGTAARYGIRSIPTLLIFHQGALVDRLVGALPKGEIQRVLERIV
jgi:thioredoxin